MKAYERLLRYAAINTQSRDGAHDTPSTEQQFQLARVLCGEMEAMGLARVYTDAHAYTYGFLPPSKGMEKEPVIGLIAHIDTSPDFSGEHVRPLLHENYDGGELPLGESGRVLSPAQFPDLRGCVGQTLITGDGSTLLGADDKAGAAEILTLCERLIQEDLPHGGLALCFSPDEEIGHGCALLDLERFGADFAYTVDGGAVNTLSYETFNAASAEIEIHGVSVHPGTAKDTMRNALLVAMELNARLPADEIPAKTEGREGFYHLLSLSGGVARADMRYIVRDHDAGSFAHRCETLRQIARDLNEKYGPGTVRLTLREQYRNMAEKIAEHMEIVERAEKAIRAAGLEPEILPVRGGTDGAKLSFRGLLCPNLGTGGAAFHGPYEHITVENMDRAVEILLHIVGKQDSLSA